MKIDNQEREKNIINKEKLLKTFNIKVILINNHTLSF